MTVLNEVRTKFIHLSAQRQQQKDRLEEVTNKIAVLKEDHVLATQAHEVIRQITNTAQNEFKDEIDKLVTLAVRSIFDENFRFDLQISTTGGRLQCKPTVWENVDGTDVEYIPKDDMGGSIIDPISYALRVALHSFDKKPTRPIFWLDEPMKNTGHGELIKRAGEMLRTISHELGLQLLIITHESELAEVGDTVYMAARVKGVTQLTNNKEPQNDPPKKQKRTLI